MKPSPLVLVASLLTRTSASTHAEVPNNLMPQPAIVQFQPGRFLITKDFVVRTSRYSDDRLRRALQRAVTRLQNRTGFELMNVFSGVSAPGLVIDIERA